MNMFTKAVHSQGSRVPQADLAVPGALLDDLVETSWLLRMAQLGLGFNPDLLALAERLDEPIGTQDPMPHAYRPIAGTQAVR